MKRSIPDSDAQNLAALLADVLPDPSQLEYRVSGASIPARLYSSKLIHRLVPARLALPIAAWLGPALRQRRNPAERDAARAFMHDLLLHTPRAGEADALAEQWLLEKARVRELFWRPWLLRRSRVLGSEHWESAHRAGDGCVIIFGHIVAEWAVPAILAFHGFDHYLVASPHFWQPLPSGYEGLALLHERVEYGENPFTLSRVADRVIPARGTSTQLIELLEAGESISIAFDVAGRIATPFLGRNIALNGGPAMLAFRSKVKLLPVIAERHGTRIDLTMLPPLDPADHSDLTSLQTAVARTFEPFVLNRPEAVQLPWFPSPLVNEVRPQLNVEPRSRSAS